MGHKENLSFEELLDRLKDNDFKCRADDCSKHCSYEVDRVFWRRHLSEFMGPELTEDIDDPEWKVDLEDMDIEN